MYNFRSNCSPLDCYISYNLYLKIQVRENRYFDIFYVVKHNLIERSLNLVSIQVLKNLPAVHRSFAMMRTSANSLSWLNSFAPNAPFLYPLKTSKNLTVFWCFQGVEKGAFGTNGLRHFCGLAISQNNSLSLSTSENGIFFVHYITVYRRNVVIF